MTATAKKTSIKKCLDVFTVSCGSIRQLQFHLGERGQVPDLNLNNLPSVFPFPDNVNFGDFTLLFDRRRLRNIQRFKINVLSYYRSFILLRLRCRCVMVCFRSVIPLLELFQNNSDNDNIYSNYVEYGSYLQIKFEFAQLWSRAKFRDQSYSSPVQQRGGRCHGFQGQWSWCQSSQTEYKGGGGAIEK